MIKIKKFNGNAVLVIMVAAAIVIALVGFFTMRQRIKNAPVVQQNNSESNSEPDQALITEPPPPPPSQLEGWLTYTNAKYDYSVQYPPNLKVGTVSGNSVLGEYSSAVKGFHVGPLVFVSLTGSLRKDGAEYFNESYNLALHPMPAPAGEPTVVCKIDTITNPNVEVKSVSCVGEGGPAKYALILGKDYDVFVDGYSKGFDQTDNGELKAATDYANILSTFKFDASKSVAVTPPPGGPTPAPNPPLSPTPTVTQPPPPPPAKLQAFAISADDSQASPSEIKVNAGAIVQITFNVSAANVYYGGLDFRSSVVNSGTVKAGQSKTISFKATESFEFTPYWPASQEAKPYKIKVIVQ